MENRFTDYYRLGGIAGIKYGARQFETDIQRSLCVNPSKKLIYYKPGKAAGTSIFRTILQPMGGWIIQKDNPIEFAEWIDNITDDEIQKYFSFIFVRNPFSRIVSSWNDTDRVRYPKFKVTLSSFLLYFFSFIILFYNFIKVVYTINIR